jgi:hypothetical protein
LAERNTAILMIRLNHEISRGPKVVSRLFRSNTHLPSGVVQNTFCKIRGSSGKEVVGVAEKTGKHAIEPFQYMNAHPHNG